MTIPPCPYCGKTDLVYRNIRMFGWAQQYFDLSGQADSLDLDKIRSAYQTKTVRCCSCGEIRHDLEIVIQNYREVVREKGGKKDAV